MDVKFEKDEEVYDFLTQAIRNYNNAHSPMHKASRKEDYEQHIVITESDKEKLIAGLTARMYWEMIYLDKLYVDQAYRHQGWGMKLLKQLIDIAREKQVNYILLTTYSFQARGFYERAGFELVGAIEDYPPGESLYTMRLDMK